MTTITTVQGDTWDTLAVRAYGDVLRAQTLMEARENIELLEIEVFGSGTVVSVPEITTADTTPTDLPSWRQ